MFFSGHSETLGMIESLKNILKFGTSQHQDASVRTFVDAWVARRQAESLHLLSIVSLSTHVSSMIFLPFVAHESARPLLGFIHGVAAVAQLIAVINRKNLSLLRFVNVALLYTFLPGYVGAVLGYTVHVLKLNEHILMASAGAMAYTIFGILFYPGTRKGLLQLIGIMVGLCFFAMSSLEGGLVWSSIYYAACGLAAATRFAMDNALEREAIREYEFRVLIAPAHMVRHSVNDSDSIREVFKAELKSCVCIASDWRDYQALSAELSPAQLTKALDEYYTLCVRILQDCLPDGNYYTDWIADELFVVIYKSEDRTQESLVEAAIEFSARLIREKVEFIKVNQVPKAIDIGISAGEALLGLMGPKGHQKATALGSTPGRARRLQSAGKFLRHRFGHKDRIIFGKECLVAGTENEIRKIHLGDHESIRDIRDREIYYIQPFESDEDLENSGFELVS